MCRPLIEICGANAIMRNFLIEVIVVVKVDLESFKDKIAGKQATLRARN
jgi:hypothetical protein